MSASQTSQNDASTLPHLPVMSLKASSPRSQHQSLVLYCLFGRPSHQAYPWEGGQAKARLGCQHVDFCMWVGVRIRHGEGSPDMWQLHFTVTLLFLEQSQWTPDRKQYQQGYNGKDITRYSAIQCSIVLHKILLLWL